MQFKGHFRGGMLAGAAAATVAIKTGFIPLNDANLKVLVDTPLQSPEFRQMAAVFFAGWFMALFPDLDVASVPQRWFVRVVFALLGLTLLAQRMDLFVVLAFLGLMPMLHHHRGWTHWKSAPWLVSLVLALAYEYVQSQNSLFHSFSLVSVQGFLEHYWMFAVAAAMGHYTHLLLDSPQIRFFPFIRNAPDHH